MRGQPKKWGFYETELQRADVYPIEKILQQKGIKVKVRWLCYDESHDYLYIEVFKMKIFPLLFMASTTINITDVDD